MPGRVPRPPPAPPGAARARAPAPAPSPSPSPSPSSQGGTSPAAPAPTAGSASAGAGAGEETPEDGPSQQAGTGKADTTGGAEKDRRKSGKQEKADRAGQDDEDTDEETETETDDQDTVVDLDGTEPTAAPVDDPAGLPVWVAPGVLVLLGAGLAGLAVVRRRRRG